MTKAYPSDLTYDQFETLNQLIPPAKPGGRPRSVDMWGILNALMYLLVEGVQWRALPSDFPKWQTVYTYFRTWRKTGTWISIHDELFRRERILSERDPSPSELIIDSQSVKSDAIVSEAVGYDAGKKIKGRKRFALVDTLGLLVGIKVIAASSPERDGAKTVLNRVKQMGDKVHRVHTVWADGGFSGETFMKWVMDTCRWILVVVLRPQQTKGFTVVKKRWVVERTFGWLMRCRRLVRDYEKLPETSETFIYLCMIRLMVRRQA